LAAADCLQSLALVALQANYVRPSFTDDDALEVVDGRHPMVEALTSDPFVPNTIQMGGGQPRSKILTGPNMGGSVLFPLFVLALLTDFLLQQELMCPNDCSHSHHGSDWKLCASLVREIGLA
jgi:dsDNA-specific endonuclease/ATPase MutS2